MKSLGFKKTIIISIIALVTLCLLTSNWIAYVNLRDNTIENVREHSKTIVNFEAGRIETWFQSKVTVIDSLAERYQGRTYNTDYVEIARLSKSIGEISAVYFGLKDGSMHGTAAGDIWTNGVADPDKYDPRTRPWYQMAKAADTPIVTDAYIDSVTKQPVVSVAKSFGEGVALADVSLSILSQTVKNIDFPGAAAVITDGAGKSLASNSSALKVGTKLTDIGMIDIQNAMISQDESSIAYAINGVEKLAFTKAIPLINGKKWYLVIGINKSIAYAEVDQALTDAVIASLVMLVIAAALVIAVLNILYRPILTLKAMIVDLSKGHGDLTRRLPVTSNDDLGQISEGINRFIENLQSLMQEVSQTSGDISSSVDQLKQQTDANNQVLTAHSMETEQVVSAIEEMSATASDVAGNASEASRYTHDTNSQVSDSRNVVTEATTTVSQLADDVENTAVSIEDIGKDSQEITSVLNVIGSIAEQTNLLALNAAIEAARAGEQGRGFAVVADEVRALAARTQSSTAEIEQTLNKLLSGSKTAIDAMNATKSTCERTTQNTSLVAADLDNIAISVTNINDLNTLIATAAEQQSSVAEDITRNMSAIRDIVGELTINGQSTATETINLSAANSQLKSVVSKFKLH
ncbi:methyl-accepting chemotaxis protein [Psychromonas aquimarina]|uniref:methyl-accepting chemotaxis protein n=1 Tax=Psychromonas aquimarina TaxID=444919 RepID=UPI000424C997|nr:methyl-accepting chemotaxis protein [Psychromonas aquimarina]